MKWSADHDRLLEELARENRPERGEGALDYAERLLVLAGFKAKDDPSLRERNLARFSATTEPERAVDRAPGWLPYKDSD